MITPQWVKVAKDSYVGDQEAQKLLQDLHSPNPPPNYKLTDGLIHYKGRLMVGKGTNLRQRLLEAIRGDPNRGHSGVQGTYHHAKGVVYWKGLKKEVDSYVTQ